MVRLCFYFACGHVMFQCVCFVHTSSGAIRTDVHAHKHTHTHSHCFSRCLASMLLPQLNIKPTAMKAMKAMKVSKKAASPAAPKAMKEMKKDFILFVDCAT